MRGLEITLTVIFFAIILGLLAQVPWPVWAIIIAFVVIKAIVSNASGGGSRKNSIESGGKITISDSHSAKSADLQLAKKLSYAEIDEIRKSNFRLIESYSNGNIKGDKLINLIAKFIDSPVEKTSSDNAGRFEDLYLAIKFLNDKGRATLQLRHAIFSYDSVGFEYRDQYDDVSGGIYERIIDGCSEKAADKILKSHIAPIFLKKPPRFPTDFTLVNVAAIPPGSFLEEGLYGSPETWWLDKPVVNRAFSISELREESGSLEKAVGKARFQKYLDVSIKSQRAFSRRSLDKVLKKQVINATDLKNGLRWAASLCYAADAESIVNAEEAVSALLGMVGSGKRTKAVDTAVSDLEAFLAYPKGIGTQGQVDRQEHLLAELRQAVEFVSSGGEPKGREFFDQTLELAKQVLLLPKAICQKEQLDALASVLKFARLNVATLNDEAYVSETAEKLVNQLKVLNGRRDKANA